MDLDLDEDGLLPNNAEHDMQLVVNKLPEGGGAGDPMGDFKLLIAMKLNNLGMDMWRVRFPENLTSTYCADPGDLPLCWGIARSEFLPERRGDIESRCRKAKRIVHPDKHPDAEPEQLHYLEEVCRGLDIASEKGQCSDEGYGLCYTQSLPGYQWWRCLYHGHPW